MDKCQQYNDEIKYRTLEEKYNKLLSYLKQGIAERKHVCTTNHAVFLDNAIELLREIGEI
jgi:hypothetical protein